MSDIAKLVDDSNVEQLPFENTPSDLDEASHAELVLMINQSSASLLFAKDIQWKSVGAALVVFGANIAIAHYSSVDRFLISLLGWFSIVLAAGTIFVLAMYQAWQVNELGKINAAEAHFSTLYRNVRDLKSRREGNFHRYTLLACMVVLVLSGAFVSNMVIARML
jgi:hypothetical protein